MSRKGLDGPDELFDLFDVAWSTEDGLGGFLESFLGKFIGWFKASGASVFLREPNCREFRLAAIAGSDSTVPLDASFQEGVGIAGACAHLREALLVHDPSEHPLLDRNLTKSRTGIASALIVPLLDAHQGCIGVLNLSRGPALEPFVEADLLKARRLARLMSLAVYNGMLVSEVERVSNEQSRLRRLAEIGQMTAAIAHEIRNPLTGILAAAQMIPLDETRATTFARVIEDETRKLNALCDDFLEFARPLIIKAESVDLVALVQRVSDSLKPQFEAASVELLIAGSNRTDRVRADVHRTEQVVRNLLLNALQACNSGGRVMIEVESVRLKITDTGSGIADDLKQKLFTPFFTTKPKGTGLGLSMVSKIVEAHGGEIRFESSVGMGSTFEIRFQSAEHKEERMIA